MTKSINWPASFRDTLIQEGTDGSYAAFRLGRLYYDNRYWAEGDVVFVRANHRIIRKAVVVGDMKCCALRDLDDSDFAMQKDSLRSMAQVIDFLSRTYEKPVTPDTEISIVYYRNEPVDPELLEYEDDPHMM